jgi:predicted Zn-dependent protease
MREPIFRILICLFLALVTSAATAETYVRNKPVPPNSFVSIASLSKYLTEEDLNRCEFHAETGEILVDGSAIAETLGPDSEANIPIVALAVALGFQKQVNSELGVVDYVAPSTLEGKKPRADAPKRKGAEYNAAAARMDKVFRESPQVANHPALERVQRIGQELAAVSAMPGLQWNFVIVADRSPNAFCTGVGWVAVTQGLLALNMTDDELAGLLAHEIGHGCRRDLEEQGYNIGTANALRSEVLRLQAEWKALTAKQASLQDQARRARQLALQMQHPSNIREMQNEAAQASREAESLDRPIRNLERDINQKVASWSDHKDFATATEFQHQDEIDADNKGLRYATQAGYSADGLMSALKKLAAQNARTFGKAAYQGGQSHPPLDIRINTMKKVLADWRK